MRTRIHHSWGITGFVKVCEGIEECYEKLCKLRKMTIGVTRGGEGVNDLYAAR